MIPPFYQDVSTSLIEAYRPEGEAYRVGSFTDAWGCRFEKNAPGLWGEVKEPFIRTEDDWEDVRIPEFFLRVDTEAVNAYCRNTDTFVLAPPLPDDLPRPFERLQFLRGTASLYMDLLDRPPGFLHTLERIHDFYRRVVETWANTNIDGIWFMDDWGSQKALLISPDLWRSLFKPLYREYVSLAHAHGKFAFFHSDGYILDILPDLVEIGVDAINSQIFCMGLPLLGRRFRGKITFWGEMDRQRLLPFGTPEEVSAAVRESFENLYADGGVIAQCEFGAGARPENVRAMFEEWEKMKK